MIRKYLHYFLKSPLLVFEIIAATFFISLLALASPLFVIQVLNRYITYGFDGTLFTLTIGVLLAIVLQYGFRLIRSRMLSIVIGDAEYGLVRRFFSLFGAASYQHLDSLSQPAKRELVINLRKVQAVYNPSFIVPLLDSPFSLLYLFAVFCLSPLLALVTSFWIILLLLVGWLTKKFSRKKSKLFEQTDGRVRGMLVDLVEGLETVRMFGGVHFLQDRWQELTSSLVQNRCAATSGKEQMQSLFLTGIALQSVCLYVFGAVLVVRGELSVGALIGANILAGKACQSVTQLLASLTIWQESKPAYKQVQQLFAFPVEQNYGTALKEFSGALALQSMTFSYTGREEIVTDLSCSIQPGSILVITGGNGSGKTTLIRLLTGLLRPGKGHILVNGVHLDQLAVPWWREQLCYLPQNIVLLQQSIRDNIIMPCPEITDAELNTIINAADLRRFLDKLPAGAMTPVVDRGIGLPPGIRKRIGIARALVHKGPVVLFDEPTEALDDQGCRAVYSCLNQQAAEKKTIIVASNDVQIMGAAHLILNLDKKPLGLTTGPHGGIR